MKAFFSKYSIIIIWAVIILVVGAVFMLVVEPDLNPPSPSSGNSAPASTPPPVVAPTPSPSVSLTIVKMKSGNSLYVQWQYLPAGTTALNIFRGFKNSTSGWSLWKTLTLSADQLSGGNASIGLGDTTLEGYSFYVEAVGGNNSGNGSGSNPVYWTSPVSEPPVATSTPPSGPPVNPPGNQPSSTPSSSSPSPPPPSNPSSSSPTSTSGGEPSPTGTPYYDPEIQIEGYGTAQTNNFWVRHVDQEIEIGWQNLPPTADSIVILRSTDEGGPWNALLTQQNPGVNGSYSLQVVDDTVNDPYYYEMNAVSGSTTIATYGPLYLAADQ